MRPTKSKTAYNSCAWRWLDQINENGTAEEFCNYWNNELSAEQREAYKKEAKELAEKNTWTDSASISKGTMY